MKISESDIAAYYKQRMFYFLTKCRPCILFQEKQKTFDTFFCDLWGAEIPQIRNTRSWYQI